MQIFTANVIGARKMLYSAYEFPQWIASRFKSHRLLVTLALLQQERNASSFPLAKRWIALSVLSLV